MNCSIESWRYCTTCGERPSIVRFPRLDDEYNEKVKEVLKEGVSYKDLDELRKLFKPGESLCPICLIKRTLRYVIPYLDMFAQLNKYIEYIERSVRIREPKLKLVEEIPTVDHISNELAIRFLREVYKNRKADIDKLIEQRLSGEQAIKFKELLEGRRNFFFEDYGETIAECKRRLEPLLRDIIAYCIITYRIIGAPSA